MDTVLCLLPRSVITAHRKQRVFCAHLRGLGVRAQGEEQAEWAFHSFSSRVSDEVSFVRGKVCI